MQQERPQKVLKTHFLSASFNTVALPRQRGCRVSNMHTDTPCTTYWCLWNIYSKEMFTLANIRVHTPCSCNKPAYKWKKSLWALEQTLVEEWLKLQLNTPLNNVRVQAWAEVLRMGLQRWKAFSVPDHLINPTCGELANFKCYGCDLLVTKETAAPVLYPGDGGMSQAGSP